MAHRHYDEDGEEGEGGLTTAKKRRRVTRVDRPRGVAAQFRQTDVSGVEEVHVHVHVQLDIYVHVHVRMYRLCVLCL